MDTLFKLTPQQSNVLLAFYESSVPGETKYLNPSDATEREFIMTMLEAAGRSATDYPHLFQWLEISGAYTGDPDLDQVQLADAGKTASGKATATTWSRSSSQTLLKVDQVLVFDSDSGVLLAQGENSAVQSGFLDCPTRVEIASPAKKSLSILHLGYIAEPNGTSRIFSYANEAEVGDSGIQVTVTNPAIQHTLTNKAIFIAVGRTSGTVIPDNTDYVYYQDDQNYDNPYLIVPFSGSVSLSGTIQTPLSISNFITSVYVNNGSNGAQQLSRDSTYTSDSYVVSTFNASMNNLTWDFPYDQMEYQQTKSIVYQSTSLGNEQDSYFLFQFSQIPFTDGTVSPDFYVCSIGTPNEPSINCTQIPNLYFWWHCLAKGTLITLEDGTQKPIEEINQKFRVKTGKQGESFAVFATVLGRHTSDPAQTGREDIFRLTTANGKSIIATSDHVIFTSSDTCKCIKDITKDDSVVTDAGMAAVISNEGVKYDDMFYALALGNADEQRRADFPHHMTSHYANGILCGDQQTTRYQVKVMRDNLEYMLPSIKMEIRQDYKSALRDRRS